MPNTDYPVRVSYQDNANWVRDASSYRDDPTLTIKIDGVVHDVSLASGYVEISRDSPALMPERFILDPLLLSGLQAGVGDDPVRVSGHVSRSADGIVVPASLEYGGERLEISGYEPGLVHDAHALLDDALRVGTVVELTR